MAEEENIEQSMIKTEGDMGNKIKEKCDDINAFLDEVSKSDLSKLSRENKKQMLKLQMKLAMLNMDDESGTEGNTEIQANEDLKEGKHHGANKDHKKADEKKERKRRETEQFQTKKDIRREREYFEKNKGALPKNKKYLDIPPSSSNEDDSDIKSKAGDDQEYKTKKSAKKKMKMPVLSDSDDKEETSRKYKRKNRDSSSSSSSSDDERLEHLAKEKKSGRVKSSDYIKILAERMDNRRAPKCDKFDEESGLSLEEYLEEFEEYCMENIKGDCKNWIKELESNLSGDLLDALKQFRKYRYSYSKLKKKLLEWYDEMEEARQEEYKNNFEVISHKKGESFYIYASRLERTFSLAFPETDPEYSTKLRKKYIETVPSSFRKMLKSIISYDNHVHKKTKWKEIKRCARQKDLELKATKKKDNKDDSESEEEIIINIGNDQNAQVESKPSTVSIQNGTNYQNNNSNNQRYNNQYDNRQSRYQGGNRRPINQNWNNQNGQNFSNQNNQQNRQNFSNQNNQQNRQNFSNQNNQQNRQNFSNQNSQQNGWNSSNQNNQQNRPNYSNQNPRNNNQNFQNGNVPGCQHCNKPGHTVDKCRILQGLCIKCAKPGHIAQDCYYNRNSRNYQANFNPSNNNTTPTDENRNSGENRSQNLN